MYRFLQTVTFAIVCLGLWRHDWTTIIAGAALLLMWRLIVREVTEAVR